MKRLFLLLPLITSLLLIGVSCGGGGGSSDSSGSSGLENGKIEGSIVEIVVKAPSNKQIFFANLKETFTVIKKAHAQEGEFCGIEVTVVRGDDVIAITETECDGTFILENIEPGEALLTFKIGDFITSTPVNIPSGGTIEIKVKIDEELVEVEELNIISGPINCDEGIFAIGDDEIVIDELIIEGDGESCIVSEGSCEINLIAEDIELKGCDFCIKAKDQSTVLIVADSEFECDGEGDNGIEAGDDSEVDIDAETCSIDGEIVENVKNVNTDKCDDLIMEDDENNEEEENEEGQEEENNDEKDFAVCEQDCIGDSCQLFCNGISGECKEQCQGAANISACLEDCSGLACGEPSCDEFCAEKVEICPDPEILLEECDEICLTEVICEDVCEPENCPLDKCLEKECVVFPNCEEICDGAENVEACLEECGDECLEYECIVPKQECHCLNEEFEIVCEEECDEECVQFGISCRLECESI